VNQTILVIMNDMPCSKSTVEFLAQLPLCFAEIHVTLMHVFRKPAGSEEMMGKKFMQAEQEKILTAMSGARERLVTAGYPPDNIRLHLVEETYPTVADGIIAEFERGAYDLVVIGRKKMSKAEEFVMGDASIKLIRALDKAPVIVVKC